MGREILLLEFDRGTGRVTRMLNRWRFSSIAYGSKLCGEKPPVVAERLACILILVYPDF